MTSARLDSSAGSLAGFERFVLAAVATQIPVFISAGDRVLFKVY